MQIRTKRRIHLIVLSALLSIATLLGGATASWASTRIGNAELQMWYRMRHTFHSAGGDNINWVQWRNEVYFWFIYDKFVDNGKIFGQDKLEIPFVENATAQFALSLSRRSGVDDSRQLYKTNTTTTNAKAICFPRMAFVTPFLISTSVRLESANSQPVLVSNRSCGANRICTARSM